jgi:hypothetical protein
MRSAAIGLPRVTNTQPRLEDAKLAVNPMPGQLQGSNFGRPPGAASGSGGSATWGVESQTQLLPSRRQLRNSGPIDRIVPAGQFGAPQLTSGYAAPTSREALPSSRNSPLRVNVARAAVVSVLVGVGYATISTTSHGFNGLGDQNQLGNSPQALAPAGQTTGWDNNSDVRQLRETADRINAAKDASAKAAAAKAAADKAAQDARQAERDRAMRDAQRNPKAVAKILLADRGWGSQQFSCLDLLWTRESNWNYHAVNASSGAYGIPQALAGSKMASIASDWRENPVTQIKWGLQYISGRYGTPCGAWAHSQGYGWY